MLARKKFPNKGMSVTRGKIPGPNEPTPSPNLSPYGARNEVEIRETLPSLLAPLPGHCFLFVGGYGIWIFENIMAMRIISRRNSG